MHPLSRVAGAAALLIALAFLPAPAATAEPATTVPYPAGASATRFTGLAFDACDAPSLAAMRAWRASPYDGVGVYIGGPNRTCAQANLTASWATTVTREGWRLIPIYMGSQAPCTGRPNSVEFTLDTASARGRAEAANAVMRAKALGMLPGSAIYGDMENYDIADTGCRTAVRRYISSWTKGLHAAGYLAGIYANLNAGAVHLAQSFDSTVYARPDALWIARWDGSPSLTGWAGIPNSLWADSQRGKQYRGDHNETYGGVTINIDSDSFDAPVATVALPYAAERQLSARSGPSTGYPVVRTIPSGSTVQVVCQRPGQRVRTTTVWDKLTDGTYVTDYYVGTPSDTTWSPPLPPCVYPYQATTALNERSGPGTSFAVSRTLPNGSLAWVRCQTTGTRAGTTSVWDRLDTGGYVSDSYVATPSKTTFSVPIPRC